MSQNTNIIDLQEQIQDLYRKAKLSKSQRKIPEAIEYLKSAVTLIEQKPKKEYEDIAIYKDLSNLVQMNNPLDAIIYLESIVGIYYDTDFHVQVGTYQKDIADIYFNCGYFDKANEYYHSAYSTFLMEGQKSRAVVCLEKTVECQIFLKNWEGSLKLLDKLIDDLRKYESSSMQLILPGWIERGVIIYTFLGKPEEAKEWLKTHKSTKDYDTVLMYGTTYTTNPINKFLISQMN